MTFGGIAQNSIYPEVPITNLGLIDAVGQNIFTVGTCGWAMYSKDDGVNWEYITIPDDYFRDLKILSTAQGDLAILMTKDELWSWNFSTEELTAITISTIDQFGDLKAIEIVGDRLYVVSVGKIHSATAPEFSWEGLTDVLYDEDYGINTTAITTTALYIGSSEGHVFEAALSGGSYVEIYDFGARVNALHLFDSGTGYATIQSASVPLKTTDGGVSWNSLNNFSENALVYANADNTVLTVNTNRFYVSNDGGEEVTYVELQSDPNVSLIFHASFTESGDIYFCGRSSTILKSTDGGLTYENLYDYNRSDLRHISFNQTGFGAVSGDQAVIYTEDEGASWATFDTDALVGDPVYINASALLSDQTILLGHSDGHALIKNGELLFDGGINLQAAFSDPVKDLILGVTELGGNNVITKSTDGASTWENKYFTDAYISKFGKTENGNLYSPIESAYLWSENEGEDWEKIDLSVEGFMTDMAMLDDGTSLFAIGGKLYESTDAGMNLSQVASGGILRNIHFFAPDHYIFTQVSSSKTSLREKHPDEMNINTIATFCGEVQDAQLVDSLLWMSFKGGHINNYNFGTDVPSATQQPVVKQLSISPNPIAIGSQLQFQASNNASPSHLQIFNLLGEQLLNIPQFSASELQIDALLFLPGVYIIRQEKNGEIFQAKVILTSGN